MKHPAVTREDCMRAAQAYGRLGPGKGAYELGITETQLAYRLRRCVRFGIAVPQPPRIATRELCARVAAAYARCGSQAASDLGMTSNRMWYLLRRCARYGITVADNAPKAPRKPIVPAKRVKRPDTKAWRVERERIAVDRLKITMLRERIARGGRMDSSGLVDLLTSHRSGAA